MKNVISANNLNYQIPYAATILQNLTFTVASNEFLGILGHNGSGKTTLMDLLMGFRGISSGSLQVLDENPHNLSRRRKDQIVFLSQEINIKGNLTISEFLNFHSLFYPQYSKEDEKSLLEIFQLDNNDKVGSLSLGQQKKLQIIAGLSARPKLLLIDEITAVLDPEARDIFFAQLILYRKKHGMTIVLATNIAEDLLDRVDRVLFIQNSSGSMHPPQEILKLFNVRETA